MQTTVSQVKEIAPSVFENPHGGYHIHIVLTLLDTFLGWQKRGIRGNMSIKAKIVRGESNGTARISGLS